MSKENKSNEFFYKPCISMFIFSFIIYLITIYCFVTMDLVLIQMILIFTAIFIVLFILSVFAASHSYELLKKDMVKYKIQNKHLLFDDKDYDLAAVRGFYYKAGKFKTRRVGRSEALLQESPTLLMVTDNGVYRIILNPEYHNILDYIDANYKINYYDTRSKILCNLGLGKKVSFKSLLFDIISNSNVLFVMGLGIFLLNKFSEAISVITPVTQVISVIIMFSPLFLLFILRRIVVGKY